jgi:glutathione S-transferase
MKPRLFIGNRNYSSWSLRPWLALRWAGVEFDETLIELDQPGYGAEGIAEIRAISPSGKVPALKIGATTIFESLAIAEWAAEQAPPRALLPADGLARAEARAVAAEMHAGFAALRRDLPMNIRRRCTASGLSEETLRDIRRIDAMWSGLRKRYGATGPWLFGQRSLADAFYLPVATRFRTYATALSPVAQAYADTLLADAAFREWEKAVLAQPAKPFTRAPIDGLYPATN